MSRLFDYTAESAGRYTALYREEYVIAGVIIGKVSRMSSHAVILTKHVMTTATECVIISLRTDMSPITHDF